MTNTKNNIKKQVFRRKKTPQRSCIACRRKQDKRDLIRLVCSGGNVEIDPIGGKAGRGAYLCPKYECWEIGLKKNRLEYALRTTVSLENRHMLIEYGKSLTEKEEANYD